MVQLTVLSFATIRARACEEKQQIHLQFCVGRAAPGLRILDNFYLFCNRFGLEPAEMTWDATECQDMPKCQGRLGFVKIELDKIACTRSSSSLALRRHLRGHSHDQCRFLALATSGSGSEIGRLGLQPLEGLGHPLVSLQS